jgi:hypothetical protein
MIGLKVVMGDPSDLTGSDAFAWVGASFNLSDYKIKFRLAKQFWNESFSDVAKYANNVKKSIQPNFVGMEVNRKDDKKTLDLFQTTYRMPWMKGINTSSGLTAETRAKGFTMDKPFMVKWFKEKLDEHMIIFPTNPTKDMQELIDQIPKISQFMTPGGQTSYKAYRGQHDDLFMAALLCCNFIRLFIEQQEQLR